MNKLFEIKIGDSPIKLKLFSYFLLCISVKLMQESEKFIILYIIQCWKFLTQEKNKFFSLNFFDQTLKLNQLSSKRKKKLGNFLIKDAPSDFQELYS